MKYEVEEDPYLNCYIVWEIHTNYKIDVYRAKSQKTCENWVKRKTAK